MNEDLVPTWYGYHLKSRVDLETCAHMVDRSGLFLLYPVELRDRCEMLIPILNEMIKAKYHQMRQDAGLARMP